MITFGNEELLADGREDLPRIVDIARPTRLIAENTKKNFHTEAFWFIGLFHVQIMIQISPINEQTPVAGSLQSALWRRLTKVETT